MEKKGIPLRVQANKKGTILIENVIFIVLNVLFLAILVLFIAKQGSGAIVLEQSYAKQISLLIDSAKPGSIIELNMDEAKKLADKNGINFEEVVKISKNIVLVKLTPDSGYEYSFFNDVDVTNFPNDNNLDIYRFTINEKQNDAT